MLEVAPDQATVDKIATAEWTCGLLLLDKDIARILDPKLYLLLTIFQWKTPSLGKRAVDFPNDEHVCSIACKIYTSVRWIESYFL